MEELDTMPPIVETEEDEETAVNTPTPPYIAGYDSPALTPTPTTILMHPDEETPEARDARYKELRDVAAKICDERRKNAFRSIELGYASWLANATEDLYLTRMIRLKEKLEGRKKPKGRTKAAKKRRAQRRLEEDEINECVRCFTLAVRLLREWEIELMGFTRRDSPPGVLRVGEDELVMDEGAMDYDPDFIRWISYFWRDWTWAVGRKLDDEIGRHRQEKLENAETTILGWIKERYGWKGENGYGNRELVLQRQLAGY